MEEWDCNEVGTLLYAYSTEEIGAKDLEYKLIDSMDDKAYRIVGEAVPTRLGKIAYYLNYVRVMSTNSQKTGN